MTYEYMQDSGKIAWEISHHILWLWIFRMIKGDLKKSVTQQEISKKNSISFLRNKTAHLR